MELIQVTMENIEKEHICCALSNNKDPQVLSKKSWLSERFSEGLVFLKGNVRGKCFIEYIPAENAWAPVQADGYMFIDCFWVSGQFAGKGNGDLLLEECIRDSKEKGKKGLCVISSSKKKGFLSDPKYLAYKGFQVADKADYDFWLFYLPFSEDASKPCFRPQMHVMENKNQGFELYYSHQCPFTAKYVPLLEDFARKEGIPFTAHLIDSREKAQNAPAAFTIFSLFYNGRFITHEIQSAGKFEKLTKSLMQDEEKGL